MGNQTESANTEFPSISSPLVELGEQRTE